MYFPIFEKTVSYFKKLPGIGEKSARRIVYALLEFDEQKVRDFAQTLVDFKQSMGICTICGFLTYKNDCPICLDDQKNPLRLCLVERIKDVFVIEESKAFDGKYHVLGGVISPTEGIFPENLNIDGLEKRIAQLLANHPQENVELILATNPTLEGEATAQYIKERIQKAIPASRIQITRIAYGIPAGGELEFADRLTVLRAFEARRIF